MGTSSNYIKSDWEAIRDGINRELTLEPLLPSFPEIDITCANILVSERGNGKSLAIRLIFEAFISAHMRGDISVVPIFIDLADLPFDQHIGTSEWLRNLLTSRGLAAPTINLNQYFFLLDSADEYFSGVSPSTTARCLNSELFKGPLVVSTRTSFYQGHMRFAPALGKANLVKIPPWKSKSSPIDFVKGLLKHGVVGRQHARKFIDILQKSKKLSQLAVSPLNTIMLLEVATFDLGTDNTKVTSVTELYSLFCHHFIEKESRRKSSKMSVSTKALLLQKIAWEFYGSDSASSKKPKEFSRSNVEIFFASIENEPPFRNELIDLNDIVENTLLTERVDHSLGGQLRIRFTHKSFHEFYCARQLFSSILVGDALTDCIFEKFITQEITQFLQEILAEFNKDKMGLIQCGNNLLDYFQSSTQLLQDLPPESTQWPRLRLAVEQSGFFLGQIADERFQIAVEDLISQDNCDPFLRRGLTIGLAFGGRTKKLKEYVSLLRDERASGGTTENSINIGHVLSYFGDQPFNPALLEYDQGLGSCEQSLTKLIDQLNNPLNKDSRTLDLYTIHDIVKHRPVSKKSAETTLLSKSDDLSKVFQEIEPVASDADLKEIRTLKDILSRIKKEEAKTKLIQ